MIVDNPLPLFMIINQSLHIHTKLQSNFFQANSYSFTVSLIMHIINRFAIAVLFPLVSTTASAAAAEVTA